MLNVQSYLLGGKTLKDLTDELGIIVKEHTELPLVILNYSQIDSPKTHPIVRECRGLVLEKDSWKIVARALPRFFNWGELADEMPLFNWKSFTATVKEDGSLTLVYWYAGKWRINTRGSFADTECGESGKTWDELIRPLLGDKFLNMEGDKLEWHKERCFVFEFCSEYNKVVRYYHAPQLSFLTMYKNEEEEYHYGKTWFADYFKWHQAKAHHFSNLSDVQKNLDWLEENDPTNEGFVIRDNTGMRWKLKNRKYLALHHMYMNGEVTPRRLIPFALSGEADELLTYFPELKEKLDAVVEKIDAALKELIEVWEQYKDVEDQKEFALAIVPKTKFNGILFQLRKEKGRAQTLADLKDKWLKADAAIEKFLF